MIGQHDYTSMNNLDISRHRHAMRYTWIHRSTDGLKDRDTDGQIDRQAGIWLDRLYTGWWFGTFFYFSIYWE